MRSVLLTVLGLGLLYFFASGLRGFLIYVGVVSLYGVLFWSVRFLKSPFHEVGTREDPESSS